ncbi:MAG: acyl-CoA dehydratase activase [Verrucomicrobia bacterium]|nr:acyl-CoA dehydratase activase [Verrucomicrobiota bacterium]
MTSHVGINIGAVTVKVVSLRDEVRTSRIRPHHGRVRAVLTELLAEPEFLHADFFGVSGLLGHIFEVTAIQRALPEVAGDFDAVVSLGGESFLVYLIADGQIRDVLSHNKCAAGTGEFFVQQIGRMGLGMEEAIRRSIGGKVVPMAARCSVHCKSDITHKLNRNEATPEDALHTLHDIMAGKVSALLEKAQRPLKRILLIGGLTRNAAMLAACRGKQPAAELVVIPESPWFEAWGTALLTRDQPHHRTPKLSAIASLQHLAPLNHYNDQVRVLPPPPPQPCPDGPLVLGVDVGSTTTKALLLDPATRAIVATEYVRTNADPVAATRRCLRSLATQVGDRPIGLVGSTGSARELAGAYLGTNHMYNEISAHAAGAHEMEPGVDTIFEIGGQDSKYIHLVNGVPIQYAMNNACSAGTGSFLEESAHGDLGIDVRQIADLALQAPAPAPLKATCAAFINSDIRVAQQEGHSQQNILAGLVYAIAANYLNRVKGSRPVGNKVFFQGGVALNRAVGNAFAASLRRPVVIPPHPELLGALGVALLALEREGTVSENGRRLLSLASPELTLASRFTCGACTMHCSIDRFQVAGRRFPFGGRCTLYENVWKRTERAARPPDLVDQRTRLLFKARPDADGNNGLRLGIPKALTTHSLYPLYAGFFEALGMPVVLSGIDPQGERRSNAGFCFPAQMAHGAVMDLENRGVDRVFLPHVSHLHPPSVSRNGYLCPITQACPYYMVKAFPSIQFLSPVLDFSRGYEACPSMVEMAVNELHIPRERARAAWDLAVKSQNETETALRELGERALQQALAEGKAAILLTGHSYTAFWAEASQSVSRKLSGMGVLTIPADCLPPARDGPTSWHFANQILNATALARRHPNLFLLCVSNFSCTLDAFTQSAIASEMGSKPYLILEMDAHTADAGVQTRLEAFLDVVHNHQAVLPTRVCDPFVPCRLSVDGRVIRASGEVVPITDPRVRIYFPSFSPSHSQAIALATRWLGMHPGEVPPLDRTQLARGLQHTSGGECLPLPICIGQLLQVHENQAPGEIAGFFMVRGGAPCVVDCYTDYFDRFIRENRFPDLFLVNPCAENSYLGFDQAFLARHLAPALLVADLLVEMEQVVRVVGAPGSMQSLRTEWTNLLRSSQTLDQFQAALPGFVDRLAALPRRLDPRDVPRVVVTGDFFTRFNSFFMEGVPDLYARHGIILKPVDLTDLMLYSSYYHVAESANGWGLRPGRLAFAKACMRIGHPDGKLYLQRWAAFMAKRWSEGTYRRLFQKTGLLVTSSTDASAPYARASEHISPTIYSEITPTVGKGMQAAAEGYSGVILIGPFNCLPYRISEAILRPFSIEFGMPLLTCESDGAAVTPSFLRQVEVHIRQVLEHHARNGARPPLSRSLLDRSETKQSR